MYHSRLIKEPFHRECFYVTGTLECLARLFISQLMIQFIVVSSFFLQDYISFIFFLDFFFVVFSFVIVVFFHLLAEFVDIFVASYINKSSFPIRWSLPRYYKDVTSRKDWKFSFSQLSSGLCWKRLMVYERKRKGWPLHYLLHFIKNYISKMNRLLVIRQLLTVHSSSNRTACKWVCCQNSYKLFFFNSFPFPKI